MIYKSIVIGRGNGRIGVDRMGRTYPGNLMNNLEKAAFGCIGLDGGKRKIGSSKTAW